jgi:flagellar assembly protein FliH
MGTETAEFTRFLFDTTFEVKKPKEQATKNYPDEYLDEEPEEVEEEPEEPPVPTFSEEELIASREEGFKAGKDEGAREAMEDSSRVLAEILQNVGAQISKLIANQTKTIILSEEAAIEVAMAVTKKLFPSLQEEHSFNEVLGAIKGSFENLLDEPKITVRAAPEYKEDITNEMNTLADDFGFEGKIVVIADENMNPGDCRIEWDSGGAERKVDTIWREIDEIVERNGGNTTPREPSAQGRAPETPPEAPIEEEPKAQELVQEIIPEPANEPEPAKAEHEVTPEGAREDTQVSDPLASGTLAPGALIETIGQSEE